jgi:hypothetical protein
MVDTEIFDVNKKNLDHDDTIPIYEYNPTKTKMIFGRISLLIIIGGSLPFIYFMFIMPSEIPTLMSTFIFLGILPFVVISLFGFFHTIYSEGNTTISEKSYYSPGIRPEITEIRIDEKGLYIKLYETNKSGHRSHFFYDFLTIPYSSITSIYPVEIQQKQNITKMIVGLHIETNEKRIGFINFKTHRGLEVMRLLKEYLGDDWRQIYKREKLISLWESEQLQPTPEVINEGI